MTTGISDTREPAPGHPPGREHAPRQGQGQAQAPAAGRRPRWARPRTLLTLGGAASFAVLLYFQSTASHVDPVALILGANPAWLALAVLATALSYPIAALGFLGFVPERISFARAVLAQLSGAFVKLVAPGGFGGIALNTRLLQRAGIAPARAVSSVGAASLVGFVLHVLQLGFFVWLSGVQPAAGRAAPHSGHSNTLPVLLIAAAAVAVLLLVAFAMPGLRRWAAARLRSLTEGALDRLRELLRHPRHLAVGLLGQLLISMALIGCLYCCVRATGAHPRFSTVAVALLVGNALGSVVPTPGGLGTVELSTAAALGSTTGLGTATSMAPVVLYRLITLLLPVLPGWAALGWLQRRDAL